MRPRQPLRPVSRGLVSNAFFKITPPNVRIVTHPNCPAIQGEASLLDVEDGVRLLIRHGSLEGSLMKVGVKRLSERVDLLQSVLLHGVQQNILRHLQTIVQIHELLVLRGVVARLLRDGLQGPVQVVDRVHQVLCEFLDGVVAGLALVTLGTLLEVAVFGDSALEFILERECQYGALVAGSQKYVPCTP